MHNSLWGYGIALAIGGMSLFVKEVFPDLTWLGAGLLCLALLLALLATLGFAHDQGWLSRIDVSFLRRSRPRATLVKVAMKTSDDASPRQAAPRAQAPRPAGPAGPVPVLEKRPKDATDDMIAIKGATSGGSAKQASDD
jgi:hypothetical protein